MKAKGLSPQPNRMKTSKLTDRRVEVLVDYSGTDSNPLPAVFHDNVVPGLRIRIGKNKRTWFYFAQYQRKGKRGTRFVRLGFWPALNVADARKAALQEAARVAAGRPQPGRREAITLEAACADYIESLKARGKRTRVVSSLIRNHLLPQFGRWSLAELSDAPALLRDHHLKISKRTPVAANRAMSILGTVYTHAARLDRSLPPASPISAVRFNREKAAQTGMPFNQFAVWYGVVKRLPPLHQGYHLLMLLTGLRGADMRRLKWGDVDNRQRTIGIGDTTKTGTGFSVPMTAAIAGALKLARPMRDGVIFPGAIKWKDRLPYEGHALRHTYITLAADINVNEVLVRLLVGHALRGVHQDYITKVVMGGGEGLRQAQRRISRKTGFGLRVSGVGR